MDITIIAVLIIVVIIAQGISLWFAFGKRKEAPVVPDVSNFQLLQKQMESLERSLDSRMNESSKAMHETVRSQLGESGRLIQEVTERLTKLDETNKQVVSFADQLQNLQNILKNPKQRGVLGEYYLETVLKNVLGPGMYQMQYGFSDGEIVDAVVFVGDKIVPIDSKFSLENYNRAIEAETVEERERHEKAFKNDLKLRIDETSKYVRPEVNTMDFAIMFIPSEGIYYDLLMNQVGAMKTNTRDLIEYAFTKKVIIVSPTSFLAYLQTVLQGLKSMQIEKEAELIQKRVGELAKHMQAYEVYYKKLGDSLSTTVNHYNSGYKELSKVDKDIYRISGERAMTEVLTLEKPHKEDEE